MRNPLRDERAWDAREARDETPLPGVIDTVGNGFAALVSRPFAILPLLLLDLYLLLMPQLTLRPLAEWVTGRIDRSGRGWDEMLREIEQLERYNAFDLAIIRAPLARLPALIPALTDAERGQTGWDQVWSGLPVGAVIAVVIVAMVTGLFVSSTYRSLAAGIAGSDAPAIAALRPARIARGALDLFLWIVLVLALLTLIALPMIVLTVAGALLGLESLAIAWIFMLAPVAWGFVHFYFSIHALFLDRRGALHALKASYRVVRRFFWQSVQFIALTFILTTGLTYLLTNMAADRIGVFLAIALNAFVATGLIVAAMLFYRDRASRLNLPTGSPNSER